MNNIARAFILILTLAASASYTPTHVAASSTTVIAKTNSMPVPTCEPDDPNACGMHRRW